MRQALLPANSLMRGLFTLFTCPLCQYYVWKQNMVLFLVVGLSRVPAWTQQDDPQGNVPCRCLFFSAFRGGHAFSAMVHVSNHATCFVFLPVATAGHFRVRMPMSACMPSSAVAPRSPEAPSGVCQGAPISFCFVLLPRYTERRTSGPLGTEMYPIPTSEVEPAAHHHAPLRFSVSDSPPASPIDTSGALSPCSFHLLCISLILWVTEVRTS